MRRRMDRPHTCVGKGQAGFEASEDHADPVLEMEGVGERLFASSADRPHDLRRMEVREGRGAERNVSFDSVCQGIEGGPRLRKD